MRRESALDGIRGIAILAVMLFHFTRSHDSAHPLCRSALKITGAGWAGVDLFFVLSGFLITGILLDTKGRPGFFHNFYVRRALRIFPLYYAVLIAVMALIWATQSTRDPAVRDLFGRQAWLWTYSINIENALTGRWDFNAGGLYLNHFWSLAIEEQFYFVWPIVVMLLSRRALVMCTLAISAGALTLRAIMTLHDAAATTVYSFTPCRLDALALGALAAAYVRTPELRRWRRLPLLAGVAAGVHLAWLAWTEDGLPWLDPKVDVLGLSSLAVLAAALLVGVSSRPRMFGALRTPPLVFLGKYSYGIYVFHYILWPRLEHYAPGPRLAAASGSELFGLVAHVAIGIAISVAVAVASFHLLERRFLALRERFSYASAVHA